MKTRIFFYKFTCIHIWRGEFCETVVISYYYRLNYGRLGCLAVAYAMENRRARRHLIAAIFIAHICINMSQMPGSLVGKQHYGRSAGQRYQTTGGGACLLRFGLQRSVVGCQSLSIQMLFRVGGQLCQRRILAIRSIYLRHMY